MTDCTADSKIKSEEKKQQYKSDHKSQSDPANQEEDVFTSAIRPDLPPALGHNLPHGKEAEGWSGVVQLLLMVHKYRKADTVIQQRKHLLVVFDFFF